MTVVVTAVRREELVVTEEVVVPVLAVEEVAQVAEEEIN
jgi:hypothetical protein